LLNKSRNVNNDTGNGQAVTITDNKTVLQALALINDCNKYKMDLTTNGVIITDAIKFVQINKEKLMSKNEDMVKNLRNQITMMTKNSWEKSRKSRLVKKQLQIQPFELITVVITF
jgi:hypothetical protein